MAKNRKQTRAVKFTIGVWVSLQLCGCAQLSPSATATREPTPQARTQGSLPVPSSWQCLQQTAIELAQNKHIIQAVAVYNQGPHGITDTQWESLDANAPEVFALTQSIAGQAMAHAIAQAAWQGEGILMGADGGLVAITEKTSDFWQADETQFSQAINLLADETFVQTQVVDQSSKLLLIKISVPVWSPDNNTAIGVLTLGLDQFVADFNPPCDLNNVGQR